MSIFKVDYLRRVVAPKLLYGDQTVFTEGTFYEIDLVYRWIRAGPFVHQLGTGSSPKARHTKDIRGRY